MSTATDMRDAYLAAEQAILSGQSYEFSGRKLTLADLNEIRTGRLEWERRVQAEANSANKAASPRYSQANFGEDDWHRRCWR